MTLINKKFPPSIALETTNYCNLSCNFCGHSKMSRSKGVMDIKTYKKIINEIAQEDKNTCLWMEFYGEPLLLKYKLVYFIRYAKDKGLKNVYLNTNGILLDEEISEAIIDSGVDKIVISLDAYYEETYFKIRNNDNFQKVKNNIIKLIEIKNNLNPSLKVEVQLIQLPNLHKDDEEEKFVCYWKRQGADVKLKEYITWNGALEIEEMRHKKRYPCGWLFKTMAIAWNGDVVQCSCDFDGKYIAGNIKKSSISYLWNDNLKSIRNLQLQGKFDEIPICEKCKDWDSYYISELEDAMLCQKK
ncbi:radical SAM/SPASM domain-containing protein [Clostridium thailandense]|uniref:radical SAM/SPASM domain-containing protein n=1 Tax=Clostridium thailandense TaxID=2794346 RepID=UPI003989C11A